MSHIGPQNYVQYGNAVQYGNSIYPGNLMPVVSQGCKSSIGKRFSTSYIPNCKLNSQIRMIVAPQLGMPQQVPNPNGGTVENRQYRLFLQKHANQLMEMNRQAAAIQANEHCRRPPASTQTSDMLFNRNEYPNFTGFM